MLILARFLTIILLFPAFLAWDFVSFIPITGVMS